MQMSSLLKSNAKEFHSRRCRCRAIENERSVARCRRNVCGNRFDGGGWRASIVLIWLDGVPSGVVMDGSGRRWRDGSHTHTHTRQSNRLSTLRGNGDAGQYFVAGQQSTTRNRILPFGCRSARDVLRHRLASIFLLFFDDDGPTWSEHPTRTISQEHWLQIRLSTSIHVYIEIGIYLYTGDIPHRRVYTWNKGTYLKTEYVSLKIKLIHMKIRCIPQYGV